MGEYEYLWNERKEFLLSSLKIGAIATVCICVFGLIAIISAGTPWWQAILALLVMMIPSILIVVPAVAVGRLVFGSGVIGGGAITRFLNGIWMMIWGILTGGWFGLVIGLLLCMIFVWVFGAVVIGYAIYLPISSIYLYVKYKKEIA